MERAVYERMAEQDAIHWWYVARRAILSAIIRRHVAPPAGARVLEIGCGTGHNFGMLGEFGAVDGLEIDAPARAIASERLGRPVGNAPLPELTGVPDGHYDLIALLDVLEHIDGDRAALASIRRKLKPGGKLLVTVPANPWMWSAHDVVHHHHRRYSAASLKRVFADAGLKIHMLSHFNTLLFPLAAAVRLLGKATNKQHADDAMPSRTLNRLFTGIFGTERFLVGRVPLPFGVSLVAVVE